MPLLDDLTLGVYRPGESLLHRLDPRLKLLGFPLLVVASFVVESPMRLLALVFLGAALAVLSRTGWRVWWRSLRTFRWLLLATLLLHLFFSPGHTLAGVVWLSLDGLHRGFAAGLQLILAVLFSSLLTLTTSPRELAAAFSWLLTPLGHLGLPVREWTGLFLLVLHFIPLLRSEAADLLSRSRGNDDTGPLSRSMVDRARLAAGMVTPLLLRLVDRADAVAVSAAAGESIVEEPEDLRPFLPPAAADMIFVVFSGGILVLLGILP